MTRRHLIFYVIFRLVVIWTIIIAIMLGIKIINKGPAASPRVLSLPR